MATRFAYSILFVADMSRSIAFYRDLIGLELKMESPEWTEFKTDGVTLALHKAAAGVDPLPHPQAKLLPAGHAHAGFNVDDIDAFSERMRVALALHDEITRGAVREHGGRLIKGTGDGIHAVFEIGRAHV